MPKQWNCSQDKKFARELTFGKTYWVISDIATNLAPFEDAQMCRSYVFTERAPFTGTPMTADGVTARDLCRNRGPVYDTRPPGMRAFGEPLSRVAAPLGSNDYEGVLDEAELRGLEKRVRDGSHPHKRRPAGNWRP
ncbi:hypothetical protein G3I51_24160 [Streptomyces sp. SID9944]|nr:hypothetical protein [Streptomyces sp. SID9944]